MQWEHTGTGQGSLLSRSLPALLFYYLPQPLWIIKWKGNLTDRVLKVPAALQSSFNHSLPIKLLESYSGYNLWNLPFAGDPGPWDLSWALASGTAEESSWASVWQHQSFSYCNKFTQLHFLSVAASTQVLLWHSKKKKKRNAAFFSSPPKEKEKVKLNCSPFLAVLSTNRCSFLSLLQQPHRCCTCFKVFS